MNLKTREEYYKKVLGIRLKGKIPTPPIIDHTVHDFKRKQETPNTPHGSKGIHKAEPEHSTEVVFYAASNDLNSQKPMIDKILALFRKKPQILCNRDMLPKRVHTLFSFGELKEIGPSVDVERHYSFPSFTEISKKNDLKRDLWQKLKKYT